MAKFEIKDGIAIIPDATIEIGESFRGLSHLIIRKTSAI